MNPMLQNLTANRTNNIKNLYDKIRMAGNPQMMFQQTVMQNPMLQPAMQYIQQNGGNAQSAFYKYAQEMGLDPNLALSQLQ